MVPGGLAMSSMMRCMAFADSIALGPPISPDNCTCARATILSGLSDAVANCGSDHMSMPGSTCSVSARSFFIRSARNWRSCSVNGWSLTTTTAAVLFDSDSPNALAMCLSAAADWVLVGIMGLPWVRASSSRLGANAIRPPATNMSSPMIAAACLLMTPAKRPNMGLSCITDHLVGRVSGMPRGCS
ncbi:Uncharacterised protein [Mycobacteroides abscessus subsp. abscessus]|nr:Uncharacterised protein [Mycobacteroides abscessus subsp. abscessus]